MLLEIKITGKCGHVKKGGEGTKYYGSVIECSIVDGMSRMSVNLSILSWQP